MDGPTDRTTEKPTSMSHAPKQYGLLVVIKVKIKDGHTPKERRRGAHQAVESVAG